MDITEYKKRQAIASWRGAKKERMPVKRLPGKSLGLFDHQLMGVSNLSRFTLNDVPGQVVV